MSVADCEHTSIFAACQGFPQHVGRHTLSRILGPQSTVHLAPGPRLPDLRQQAGVRYGQHVSVFSVLQLREPLDMKGIRLVVEWRQRVAGRAEPGSGPALILARDF